MKTKLILAGLTVVLFISCSRMSLNSTDLIRENIDFAREQIGHQVKLIEVSGKVLNPRTVKNNQIEYVPLEDWTSGFFPGTMWYMYDLTGDKKWEELGIKYTEAIDSAKNLKWHHDVGFMIGSSFGNGYKYTKNEVYKNVLIEAAKSLSTRFRPVSGVIQSWNVDNGWQSTRDWMCPVIIDNMMNLELLFRASEYSGNPLFRKIALSHADVTMKNHFRSDFSCYHVIDYDSVTGQVRKKNTAQGYSDESSWARGQAWALYGYMICYRETKEPKYLEMVDKIYSFVFNHPNLPADLIPYWDFNAPNIPNEPRDVSTASIIASALYQMSSLGRPEYKAKADNIIKTLSGPSYRAILGTNGNFLLMHSVGSIPHDAEIDVPLNYADYYFLEALIRKRDLEK